jgi:catechol 2,3-dioxygenase-like lactoylglutathione lyase family enzyme
MPSLDAIGIVVSDLRQSLAFYRLLGFDLPDSAEGHVEAPLPGGLRLMLDTEEMASSFSEWSPPTGGSGRVTLALLCADPAEVDHTHAMIIQAGHRSAVAPFDAPWGQRYATVLDPDGNAIDLFAPQP